MSQDFFPHQEQESDDYNAFNNKYLNPPLATFSLGFRKMFQKHIW